MSQRIVVAGGHGQIAMHLHPLLHARGDEVVALIRNPAHTQEVEAAGATPVVCDLESAPVEDVARAVGRADAVVFAAGAGPGSGVERKLTMDRDGALRLLAAATENRVRRYVMVSAMGARTRPPAAEPGDVFANYLRAKHDADQALMATDGVGWTVVRPGRLTDDEPTGTVQVAEQLERGEITRADVAAVLAAVLADERLVGRHFDLVGGPTPIPRALEGLLT